MKSTTIWSDAPGGGIGPGFWCQIIAPWGPPSPTSGGAGINQAVNAEAIYSVFYMINITAGVTAGSIVFQATPPDKVNWITLTAPVVSPVSATSLNYTGQFFGPFLGIRMQVVSLTGGTCNFLGITVGY